MQTTRWQVLLVVVVLVGFAHSANAQVFRKGGVEFNASRTVVVTASQPPPAIVVTEFFHHGEISADGRNVAVTCKGKDLLPCRVLQLGPGDYCRLAFQTSGAQTEYEILYGGDPPENPPKWTSQEGLLLETREFKNCNLNSFEAVRDAFNSAKPIGADYVESVNHGENPFSLKQEPFLSKYSGVLRIANAGKYGFLTSSQDASFLVIDDKVVVDAPGKHGPAYDARPGSRKDTQLGAGNHKFEYYHAAAGNTAIMVAAWEINAQEEKPKPVAIPGEQFHVRAVAHLPATAVQMRTVKLTPDFLVGIEGDVPLPDNDQALIGVAFKDQSPKALSMGAKTLWDFGDGQTSDKPNPDHVYLKPGLYTVKLSFKRAGGKPNEIANKIYIDRPLLTKKDKEKFHTLDNYLPVLDTYDPQKLDSGALGQLVSAYVAKADNLLAEVEEKRAKLKAEAEDPEKKPEEPKRPTRTKKPAATPRDPLEIEAAKYIAKAVSMGKAPFLADSAAKGDEDLHRLAQIVGPMARDTLGDSELAFAIYKGGASKINIADLKADCETDAADIALNDLLDAKVAKALLDTATPRLGGQRTGAVVAKLQRVWGDYYATVGDGKAAQKAYLESEQILAAGKKFTEQTAWRGARSRSTEDFIKNGEFDRASAELHEWQRDFPGEKIDGYMTMLAAQYWAAREKYDQAIAQTEQLQAVNRDSAYVDQALLLAADCELKRGKQDRALATLHSLLKDYPGSPLVPDVKDLIGKIESGQIEQPKKRPRAKPAEK